MNSENWEDYNKIYGPKYKELLKRIREILPERKLKIVKDELKVISFIKEFGIDALSEEYSFHIKRSKDSKLFLLQPENFISPKDNIIVEECSNGLVIDSESLEVISYPLPKLKPCDFFKPKKYKQKEEEMDWKSIQAVEIESDNTKMVHLYYHDGKWKIYTTKELDGNEEILKTYINEKEFFYHFEIENSYNPWKFFTSEISIDLETESEFFTTTKEIKFKTIGDYFWYLWDLNEYQFPKNRNCFYTFELSCCNIISKKYSLNVDDYIKLLAVRDKETYKKLNFLDIGKENNYKVFNLVDVKDKSYDGILNMSRFLDIEKKRGYIVFDKDMNRMMMISPQYQAFKRLMWSKTNEVVPQTKFILVILKSKSQKILENSNWKDLYQKINEKYQSKIKKLHDAYEEFKNLSKRDFSLKIADFSKFERKILQIAKTESKDIETLFFFMELDLLFDWYFEV